MCNIWRQRHLPQLIKYCLEHSLVVELYKPVSILNHIKHLSGKLSLAEYNPVSRSCLLSRFNKHLPDIVLPALKKKYLYGSTCPLPDSHKPCRNNLSVVKHKTVSRVQVIYYILKYLMLYRPRILVKKHKP